VCSSDLKPGYKIIQADYIQAEAVVVAYLPGDYKLIKMFKDSFGLSKTERSRYDVHKITYAQMAGIDVDQVSKEQRTAGKTVRHATSYSAGPQVLANRLGIKLSEAKILMDMYHKANPSLRMWYTSIQQELKKNRVLTNLFGRKHRFLDRWGDSLFRSSYSYKPQSTVGDLLNTALLRIYNSILELPFETIILLQLHDAVYVMVKEENVMDTIKFLRKQMLIPLECNNEEFTIDVDFGVGESWGEKEEVEINWRNN
jgi:DNA polymerase-1